MEYSRSSPLFLLSFSLLLLLSRLSSFSAQPPVPAREPERPGVEWHKRKRKGEKREGRKESGERSRGRSETETAKPPINFSLTTISTHNFPSLHLSRRKSPRLHHLLSLSLFSSHACRCVRIKIELGKTDSENDRRNATRCNFGVI